MTKDPSVPFAQLEKDLKDLKYLLAQNNVNDVKTLLEKLIKLYKPNSEIVDHVYVEKSLSKKYEKKISNNFKDKVYKYDEDNKVIKFIK